MGYLAEWEQTPQWQEQWFTAADFHCNQGFLHGWKKNNEENSQLIEDRPEKLQNLKLLRAENINNMNGERFI